MSSLNYSIFSFFHHFAGRWLFLDVIGIFLAEYLPYFVGFAFLILVFRENGWRRRFYLFAEGILAIILSRGLVAETIHFFYYHPRPFEVLGFAPLIPESGSSFPSGHMAFFFALAMAVWYANRKWGIWYFILAALIGVARIFVGVHWPLDIIGGALIGLLCGWFIHWLLRGSRKKLYPAT
ncbi:MAG: phosphatase PAP2 family protein [Patescibacteria group bacterium]|nr:phosphatase PAP2 family protein [Patescibacteria group bacterium]